MKNEIKILIAAIVVIIIVLAGAYALSGSQNAAPSVTPTAAPVTATPTPVPAGSGAGSGSGSGTPSPSPTATATATATPTPSTEPASGVKQTEFGYWITYPPLDPQTWSTNPPPQVDQGPPNNTVYFNPTSGSVDIGNSFWDTGVDEDYTATATLYRKGDLNGTTTVTVHTDTTSGLDLWLTSVHSYYIVGDVDYISPTDFTVTFDPDQSSYELPIYFKGLEEEPESIDAAAASHFADLTLTIVDVDDGYTYGYNKQYKLTVNTAVQPCYVTFDYDGGWFYTNSYLNSVNAMDTVDWHYGDSIASVTDDGDWAYVTISLRRYTGDDIPYTTGDMDVDVSVDYVSDPDLEGYTLIQPHFSDGSSTANLVVKIPMSYIMDENWSWMDLYIDDGDYMIGPYDEYELEVNSD